MISEDNGSLEHVNASYSWFREEKRRKEAEAKARYDLNDIYEGYYPDEDA